MKNASVKKRHKILTLMIDSHVIPVKCHYFGTFSFRCISWKYVITLAFMSQILWLVKN